MTGHEPTRAAGGPSTLPGLVPPRPPPVSMAALRHPTNALPENCRLLMTPTLRPFHIRRYPHELRLSELFANVAGSETSFPTQVIWFMAKVPPSRTPERSLIDPEGICRHSSLYGEL